MSALDLDSIRFVPGTADNERTGLLGYVAFRYGDIVVDGATVRRTRDGVLSISFPARTDRAGRKHPFVRPVDQAARRELERAVLRTLGLEDTGGREVQR